MKPSYEDAVARYLDSGGRISSVKETQEVSEAELLRFLADCGKDVRYLESQRQYKYQRRRISASAVLAMANEHRSAMGLRPFVLRAVMPWPSRGYRRYEVG